MTLLCPECNYCSLKCVVNDYKCFNCDITWEYRPCSFESIYDNDVFCPYCDSLHGEYKNIGYVERGMFSCFGCSICRKSFDKIEIKLAQTKLCRKSLNYNCNVCNGKNIKRNLEDGYYEAMCISCGVKWIEILSTVNKTPRIEIFCPYCSTSNIVGVSEGKLYCSKCLAALRLIWVGDILICPKCHSDYPIYPCRYNKNQYQCLNCNQLWGDEKSAFSRIVNKVKRNLIYTPPPTKRKVKSKRFNQISYKDVTIKDFIDETTDILGFFNKIQN